MRYFRMTHSTVGKMVATEYYTSVRNVSLIDDRSIDWQSSATTPLHVSLIDRSIDCCVAAAASKTAPSLQYDRLCFCRYLILSLLYSKEDKKVCITNSLLWEWSVCAFDESAIVFCHQDMIAFFSCFMSWFHYFFSNIHCLVLYFVSVQETLYFEE